MYFNNINKNITYFKKPFIISKTVAHAGLRCYILNKKYQLPWAMSSIANSRRVVLKKIYSEYLERVRVGFQSEIKKDIELIGTDYFENYKFSRKNLSYGYNNIYGVVDTTGSSSGNFKSSYLLNKAVNELLEKNELLLSWYGGLCKKYEYTEEECVKYLEYFNEVSDLTDEFFTYVSRNLSNAYCVMFFLFRNKKLVGSGVSLNLSIDLAFKGAIEEAKLLTTIYNKRDYGLYNTFNDKEHNKIYKHIFKMNCNNSVFDFEDVKLESCNKNLIFNFNNDLKIGYLNLVDDIGGSTIKVYSEYLYNCLPTLENIKIKRKKVLEDYNINIDNKNLVDCIVI